MTVVVVACEAAPAAALLSLAVGTGATLTPLQPGQTATGTGSITATTLLPWTLTVADSGAGAGHLVKAGVGCTGSAAQLTNPLTVTVTSAASGFTSAGSKTIGAAAKQVASGSSALLLASVFTTSYSQVVPSAEVLLTGCVYTMTVTYTLQ